MKSLAFYAALVAVVALCLPAWSAAPIVKWSQPVDTTNPVGQISETCPVTVPSPGVQDDRSADDWKCTDGTPITHVRWWGDYHRYLDTTSGTVDPPTFLPTSFILRQYANDATDPANTIPGALIKEVEIPIADCNQTFVQTVYSASLDSHIHIFSYEATLLMPWTQEKDSIYWLSIQAKFASNPQEQVPIPFMNWEWLNTPLGDFLGTGLVSYDAGLTWTNPFAPDKHNFAFELMVPAPLVLLPSTLTVGQNFSVYLALTQDITQPFDFYILADTPAGPYTLYLNGKIKKGITPLYKNVQSFTKDFITTVRPAVKIPASMKGKTITFYTVIVQAGKKPPVKKLSDLTSTTQYVILMDKGAAVVN
ncbi:MAG: hypothetical protein NTX71_03360 [Candidatus Aureabacteria bacterium]|nr:hypothetical protein [Candidatus Auribacterota bacterium]